MTVIAVAAAIAPKAQTQSMTIVPRRLEANWSMKLE